MRRRYQSFSLLIGSLHDNLKTNQQENGYTICHIQICSPVCALLVSIGFVIEIAVYHGIHYIFTSLTHVLDGRGIVPVGHEIGAALYCGQHPVHPVG